MAVMKLAKLAGLILDKNGDPIGMSTQDTVQVMAINSLLDRAYGKSKQPVEQLGEDGNVVNPGQQVFVLQIQR
jgi:hypothetical protein